MEENEQKIERNLIRKHRNWDVRYTYYGMWSFISLNVAVEKLPETHRVESAHWESTNPPKQNTSGSHLLDHSSILLLERHL